MEFFRCIDCQEIVEIQPSADLPHFCPECRSIDTLTEIEEDDEIH